MTTGGPRIVTVGDFMRAAEKYSAPADDARVSPHDLDVERALLGAVLVDQRQLEAIDLTVSDLFRDAHQRIYQAMLTLHERGDPIDFITLRVALGAADLERVGGPAYIAALLDGVPRSANAAAYARRVRELAAARQAIAACTRATALLHDDPGALGNGLCHELTTALEHARGLLVRVDPRDSLIDDVALLERPAAADLVVGRLRARSLILNWGTTGSGKTTLATDLSCAVATGRPWLGAHVAASGTVVYVLAEGADSFGPRIRAWKRHASVPLDETIGLFTWPAPVHLLEPASVGRFISLARPLAPTLVVIDTFARCFIGGDENSVKDVSAAVGALDRLRDELQAAVVVLHHATKSGDRERGSSALGAAADTVLQLAAVDDLLTLTCEKQRDSAPFSALSLRLVPDGAACRIELAGTLTPSGPLSPMQERLLHELQRTFSAEGATAREWLAACPGLHERAFYRAKKQLAARGLIRRAGPRFVTGPNVSD